MEYAKLTKGNRAEIEEMIKISLEDLTDYEVIFVFNYMKIATLKHYESNK